jgi:general stress protein YciG
MSNGGWEQLAAEEVKTHRGWLKRKDFDMPDNKQGSGRGFASMDEDKQREIASEGGKASGGNFANDPERATEAGRKGGQQSAEERSGNQQESGGGRESNQGSGAGRGGEGGRNQQQGEGGGNRQQGSGSSGGSSGGNREGGGKR